MEKARKDIEAELQLLYKMLPEYRDQKQLDMISGSIDDCLDVMAGIERELLDTVDDANLERDEAKRELEESKTRVGELENLTVNEIAEDFLEGNNQIGYQTENIIDEWIMAAIQKLLAKGRPHELLRTLEKLADPVIAREVDEVIEFQEMMA